MRPEELTDVEIEQAITPVFDFFDTNLPTLNTYLSDTTKETVMVKVWKEILNVLEGLLIPPLSAITSDMKPLSDKEVDIVFKWLKVRGLTAHSIPLAVTPSCSSSSGITSMLVVRALFPWSRCKIRSTVMCCPFDCTMTGTRTYYTPLGRGSV